MIINMLDTNSGIIGNMWRLFCPESINCKALFRIASYPISLILSMVIDGLL